MEKIFSVLVFIIISTQLRAQKVNISGRVKAESQVLSNASVVLRFNKDSSLVKGTATNEAGEFQFNNVNKGKYIIEISYLGYFTLYQNIEVTNTDISLNNIEIIPDSVQLKSVIVAVRKPFISRQLDKTIINIENSIYSKGETGYSLFNVIPGIVADNMGNINYEGQRSVTIYIDNRKVQQLSGDALMRYLRSIPSESIKSYEVRTVSGAEFEGSTTGVVINIVLKKNYRYGLTGSVSSNYEQHRYANFGNGFLMNYRTGKFNFQTSYNYFKGRSFSDDVQDQYYNNTGIHSQQVNRYKDKNLYVHNISVDADYNITNNQLLSAGYRLMYMKANSIGNVTNSSMGNFNTKTIDSFFTTINDKDLTIQNQQFNILYRNKIDSAGSKIDIAYSYVEYKNILESFLGTNFYKGNDSLLRPMENLFNNNPQHVDISTVTIDVDKYLKKNVHLKFGSKYNYSLTNNAIDYYFGNFSNQIHDTIRSNTFRYDEKILAFYGSLAKDWKQWSLNVGLRTEFTDYTGKSRSVGSVDGKKFISNKRFDWFPSLFIQNKLNNNNSIVFSYSRKISRPSYDLLNPFQDIIDPYFISMGNPQLLPYFTHSFELSWLLKSKYSFTTYYYLTNNIINQSYQTTERVITESYANLNDQRKLGFSFNTSLGITKWWEMSPNVSLAYVTIYVKDRDKSYEKLSRFFSVNNRLTVSKNCFVNISGFYMANFFYSIYDWNPQGRVNVSVKRLFFNKKLAVDLNFNDPFHLQKIGYDVNETTFSRYIRRTLPTRSVSIGVSYIFSQGKKSTQNAQKGTINQSEMDRL